MINVSVVCPLKNSEGKLDTLRKVIFNQKGVNVSEVVFPVTESDDNTAEKAKMFKKSRVFCVENALFSHSIVREKAIRIAKENIVIVISDDIDSNDENLFFKLAKDIDEDKSIALSFARQVSMHRGIEKYIREINYPTVIKITSKEDIEKIGLKAFFASDVCMAYNKNIFLNLGGYDDLDLPTNEDMYFAKKVLLSDHKVKYNSEAVVIHSHKYTLKALYRRYYEVGRFFGMCSEFKNYKVNISGFNLSLAVFKKILCRFDIISLFCFIPNMLARYLGKKHGQKYELKRRNLR